MAEWGTWTLAELRSQKRIQALPGFGYLETIHDYLRTHSEEIGARILSSYRSLHSPGNSLSQRVAPMLRTPYPAQARRVSWQKLLHARNEYIDWQEFCLWARLVLESTNRIPEYLIKILNERYPGFVENEKEVTPRAAKSFGEIAAAGSAV